MHFSCTRSISSASDLDEDVLQRGVDQAPGGDVQRALGLLHFAEHLGDLHPLLGQLELLRPGDVVRPLGGGADGPDQPLHRLVLARRRRRHREHERATVLRLQLPETNMHAIAMLVLKTESAGRREVVCVPLWRFRCTGDVHTRLFLSGRIEPQPLPWNALEVEEDIPCMISSSVKML